MVSTPTRTESDEAAPLLQGHDAVPRQPITHARRVTLLLTGIVFVVSTGIGLIGLPTLRILEDLICRQRLEDAAGGIDESLCKGADVQEELSFVVAIYVMLEAFPGLVFAFPYGLLADRIGRRPVFALSIVGIALCMSWLALVMRYPALFPNVRLIWTATIWQSLGGGVNVMISMLYSMIADVEPAENLSDAFYIAIVASLAAEFVSVAVSSRLMLISPWIPILLGIALIVFSGLCILLVPETLKPTDRDDSPTQQNNLSFTEGLKDRLTHLMEELKNSAEIIRSPPVLALLLTFIINGFTARALAFGAQYLSKTLNWTIAHAGMVMSSQVITNMALYAVILPGASRLLVSDRLPFRLPPVVKDLVLARTSALFLVAGALLIAIPSAAAAVTGLVVFTLGLGFSTLCRVLVTALVEPRQTARLYTLISVLDGCGKLSAGPAIAWLFKAGLAMGEGWLGLPYLGLAGLCFLAWVLVCSVRSDALLRATRVASD